MRELHRGRLAEDPQILAVRPLVREDLACLRQKRVVPRTKSFRDAHHRLARLISSGIKDYEVLRITGYSAGRLAVLKADPAFQELISQYREKITGAFVNSQDEFYEASTSNMLRAERMIEEHLDRADETDELVPIKTLLAITSDRADRFGYPKKKEINNNYNIDFAKRIERVMARSGRGAVIDAKANPPGPSASIVPEAPDSGTDEPAVVGVRRQLQGGR